MSIIIKNKETGETRTLEKLASGYYPNFRTPWAVVNTPTNVKRKADNDARNAKLATLAATWGVPVQTTLAVARWLFGKNCPYCEVGGEFLGLLESGKITESECRDLVFQTLRAKDQDNKPALMALKGRLEEIRNSL